MVQRQQRYHVCGEVLEYHDFKSLVHPNWLNDKIINAYLFVLRSQCNRSDVNHVYIIPSYMAVLWDAGRFKSWMIREIELALFKWILMPINVTNNHWILLVADVQQMSVSILDSMNTRNGLSYVAKWKKFMQNRAKIVGELDGEWKLGHLKSAQQDDGNSCGPFVLLNALAVTREILLDSLSQEHALLMRKFVFSTLLKSAVKPPGQRTKCDMPGCLQPGRSSAWVACDVCGRWCHFNCVALKRKPKREYLCPICTAQYR
ncbi:Ubiquitin-like-specific protease 1 [Holothuria leucospilota]|uniref:Ubiquitin-like-specific protease 1 n=1 Tax=Holothuria leucospilota TaxID=206669 RepID=A0A9Q1HM95_HOLLE|nr:Ubiquitin-like-specific protease 1 [Holothuria leucospilota]